MFLIYTTTERAAHFAKTKKYHSNLLAHGRERLHVDGMPATFWTPGAADWRLVSLFTGYGGFHTWGYPIAGWFIRAHPIQMDDL